MSPSKPADCELPTCLQEDRIDANESAIGALTREIATVLQRIGHHEDTIAGKEGQGLVGAFDKLSEKVDKLQDQTQRDSQEQRLQNAKSFADLGAEIAALRGEFQTRKEAPGKWIKWAVTILPLLAALVGAVSWAINHLRFVP